MTSFGLSFCHGQVSSLLSLLVGLAGLWGLVKSFWCSCDCKLSTEYKDVGGWERVVPSVLLDESDGSIGGGGNRVESRALHFSGNVFACTLLVFKLGILVFIVGRVYLAAINTSLPTTLAKNSLQYLVFMSRMV